MNKWRVGNLSSGILLIITGFVLLTSLIFRNIAITQYIFKLWPIVLIILGVEILAYIRFSKEEGKVKYDFLSVVMIMVIGVFSIGAYTISVIDIIPKLSNLVNRQEYSILMDDKEIDIDKNIDKIIMNLPKNRECTNINIKKGTDDKIIVMGRVRISGNSKEESQKIVNNFEIKTREIQNTMYVDYNNPYVDSSLNVNIYDDMEYTIFLPKNKSVEVMANNRNVDIDSSVVKNKWIINDASQVYIRVDQNDDLAVFATDCNDFNGNVAWNKQKNPNEENTDYDKKPNNGNVTFKEGLNKLYIIKSHSININLIN